jgi:hypothetical protein
MEYTGAHLINFLVGVGFGAVGYHFFLKIRARRSK